MDDRQKMGELLMRARMPDFRRERFADIMAEIVSASRAVLAEALKPLKEHDKKVMMAADNRLAEAIKQFDGVAP